MSACVPSLALLVVASVSVAIRVAGFLRRYGLPAFPLLYGPVSPSLSIAKRVASVTEAFRVACVSVAVWASVSVVTGGRVSEALRVACVSVAVW